MVPFIGQIALGYEIYSNHSSLRQAEFSELMNLGSTTDTDNARTAFRSACVGAVVGLLPGLGVAAFGYKGVLKIATSKSGRVALGFASGVIAGGMTAALDPNLRRQPDAVWLVTKNALIAGGASVVAGAFAEGAASIVLKTGAGGRAMVGQKAAAIVHDVSRTSEDFRAPVMVGRETPAAKISIAAEVVSEQPLTIRPLGKESATAPVQKHIRAMDKVIGKVATPGLRLPR